MTVIRCEMADRCPVKKCGWQWTVDPHHMEEGALKSAYFTRHRLKGYGWIQMNCIHNPDHATITKVVEWGKDNHNEETYFGMQSGRTRSGV